MITIDKTENLINIGTDNRNIIISISDYNTLVEKISYRSPHLSTTILAFKEHYKLSMQEVGQIICEVRRKEKISPKDAFLQSNTLPPKKEYEEGPTIPIEDEETFIYG